MNDTQIQTDLTAVRQHLAERRAKEGPARYHQVAEPRCGAEMGRWRRYQSQLASWPQALGPYREHFGYAG